MLTKYLLRPLGAKWYDVTVHKYALVYGIRSIHRKPRPVTPREAVRSKRLSVDSLNWTKPLIEYQKKKQNQKQTDNGNPHMIHVVTRVKKLFGRPWWEKDICEEFGISEQMHKAVPLKNVPSVNTKLNEIKHLVKIQALQFPHGLPEDESDLEYAQLKSDGKLYIKKKVCTDELNSSTPDYEPVQPKKQLTLATIQKETERIKKRYEIYREYYKTEYVYKFNQDGKEYRYTKYPYK